MKSSLKISIIFTFILIGLIALLTFGVKDQKQQPISVIEIDGNVHLPKTSYYQFADLTNKNEYKNLTLRIIRDRLIKHPYTKSVNVEYAGSGIVKVNLKEKDFKALLLANGKQYLITSSLEIIPLLENSQRVNYPVIRNIENEKKLALFKSAYDNKSLVNSFRILTAAKLLNPGLYDNLSEIDMRNGGDIVIYFSLVNYPVILGKKDEVSKMVIFEKLWETIGNYKADAVLNYVDLRFDKKVYIGVAGDKIEVKESKS